MLFGLPMCSVMDSLKTFPKCPRSRDAGVRARRRAAAGDRCLLSANIAPTCWSRTWSSSSSRSRRADWRACPAMPVCPAEAASRRQELLTGDPEAPVPVDQLRPGLSRNPPYHPLTRVLVRPNLIARTIPLHRRLSHVIRLKTEKLRPQTGIVPTIRGRNQKAIATPRLCGHNWDDPPIHIRPIIPAISVCQAKEPFRFRPLRHVPRWHSSSFNCNEFFCGKRQELGDKGIRRRPRLPAAVKNQQHGLAFMMPA